MPYAMSAVETTATARTTTPLMSGCLLKNFDTDGIVYSYFLAVLRDYDHYYLM